MSKVKIWGHRRSGNNFLKHSLKLNFKEDVMNHHWAYDEYISNELKKYPSVFMVRDGRDVMVSSYYWWKAQKGAGPHFVNRSFKEFIYGEIRIIDSAWMCVDDKQNYTRHLPEPKMYSDPVGYWVDYMLGWYNKLYTIKFEDLKEDPATVIENCGKHLNLKQQHSNIKTLDKLVGHAPRKGVIGDWKNYFDTELSDYFWSKAKGVMGYYGYQ